MTLFQTDHRQTSADHARVYAAFEIAHTLADFLAAALFILGSVFFFYDSLTYAGTWLFLAGSLLFALKPTLRLWRELRLAAMGDADALAERLRD